MAGFSPQSAASSARDLERSPKITQALVAERAKNAKILGISREDVLNGIMRAVEDAKMMADPANQIAGWREIAKICGFYAPEIKKVVLDEGAQAYLNRLEKLDDAELLRIAEGKTIDSTAVEVTDDEKNRAD